MAKSTWASNFGSSVKFGAVQVASQMTPGISRLIDTNREYLTNVIDTLNELKSGQHKLSTAFEKSAPELQKTINAVNDAVNTGWKNTKYFFKTGDMQNDPNAASTEAEAIGEFGDINLDDTDAQMDSEMKGLMDFSDLPTVEEAQETGRDVGAEAVVQSTKSQVAAQNATAHAIVDTGKVTAANIARSTGAIQSGAILNAKATQAGAQSIVKSNLALMSSMQEASNTQTGYLQMINDNLNNLITYQNETHTKYVMAAMQYFDESLAEMKAIHSILDRVYPEEQQRELTKEEQDQMRTHYDRVFSGGFDLQAYVNVVKENFLNNEIGGVFKHLFSEEFLAMVVANPVAALTETLIQSAVPALMRQSILKLDEAVTSFIPAFFAKISSLGMQENANPILQFIGEVFGIRAPQTRMHLGQFEKGAVPFDGITHRTINQVIPTYLSKILAALTGGEEHYYNYDIGQFETMADIRARDMQESNLLINRAFGEVGAALDRSINNLIFETDQQKRVFTEAIKQFKVAAANSGQFINWNDSNQLGEIMRNINVVGMTDNERDAMTDWIQAIVTRQDKAKQMQAAMAAYEYSKHMSANLDNKMARGDLTTWIANSNFTDVDSLLEAEEANKRFAMAGYRQGSGSVTPTPIMLSSLPSQTVRGAYDHIYDFLPPDNRPEAPRYTGSYARDVAAQAAQIAREEEQMINPKDNPEYIKLYRQGHATFEDLLVSGAEHALEIQKEFIEEQKRRAGTVNAANPNQIGLPTLSGGQPYDPYADDPYFADDDEAKRRKKANMSAYEIMKDKLVTQPTELLEKGVGTINEILYRILFGSNDNEEGVVTILTNSITNLFMSVKDWLGKEIFGPLKEYFFGDDFKETKFYKSMSEFFHNIADSFKGQKMSDGTYQGGIGSDMINEFADIGKEAKNIFQGDGYTDSTGKVHPPNPDSIVGNMKETLNYLWTNFKEYLFGKEDTEAKKSTEEWVKDFMNDVNGRRALGGRIYKSGTYLLTKNEKVESDGIQDHFATGTVPATGFYDLKAGDKVLPAGGGGPRDIERSQAAEANFMFKVLNKTYGGIRSGLGEVTGSIHELGGTIVEQFQGDKVTPGLTQEVRKLNENLSGDHTGTRIDRIQELVDSIVGAEGAPGRRKPMIDVIMDKILNAAASFTGALGGATHFDNKHLNKEYMKDIRAKAPKAIARGLVGGSLVGGLNAFGGFGLLGSFLLPGGFIPTVLLGTGISILHQNEKFMKMMYGEQDENGERQGGIVSKGAQEFIKKNKTAIIGGALFGAAKAAVFGAGMPGILGSIPVVGTLGSLGFGLLGPVLVGSAVGLALKSEAFHRALFGTGDPKDGEKATGALNGAMAQKIKKVLPNAIVGAGLGALGIATMPALGGVGLLGSMVIPTWVGALTGSAIGIGLASDKFRDTMFGKYDEKSGKFVSGGLVDTMKNAIRVEVLKPLAVFSEKSLTKMQHFLATDILYPLAKAFYPYKSLAEKIVKDSGQMIKDILTSTGRNISILFNTILGPLKSLARTAWDTTWSITKTMLNTVGSVGGTLLSMPFKAVGLSGTFIANRLRGTEYEAAIEAGRERAKAFKEDAEFKYKDRMEDLKYREKDYKEERKFYRKRGYRDTDLQLQEKTDEYHAEQERIKQLELEAEQEAAKRRETAEKQREELKELLRETNLKIDAINPNGRVRLVHGETGKIMANRYDPTEHEVGTFIGDKPLPSTADIVSNAVSETGASASPTVTDINAYRAEREARRRTPIRMQGEAPSATPGRQHPSGYVSGPRGQYTVPEGLPSSYTPQYQQPAYDPNGIRSVRTTAYRSSQEGVDLSGHTFLTEVRNRVRFTPHGGMALAYNSMANRELTDFGAISANQQIAQDVHNLVEGNLAAQSTHLPDSALHGHEPNGMYNETQSYKANIDRNTRVSGGRSPLPPEFRGLSLPNNLSPTEQLLARLVEIETDTNNVLRWTAGMEESKFSMVVDSNVQGTAATLANAESFTDNVIGGMAHGTGMQIIKELWDTIPSQNRQEIYEGALDYGQKYLDKGLTWGAKKIGTGFGQDSLDRGLTGAAGQIDMRLLHLNQMAQQRFGMNIPFGLGTGSLFGNKLTDIKDATGWDPSNGKGMESIYAKLKETLGWDPNKEPEHVTDMDDIINQMKEISSRRDRLIRWEIDRLVAAINDLHPEGSDGNGVGLEEHFKSLENIIKETSSRRNHLIRWGIDSIVDAINDLNSSMGGSGGGTSELLKDGFGGSGFGDEGIRGVLEQIRDNLDNLISPDGPLDRLRDTFNDIFDRGFERIAAAVGAIRAGGSQVIETIGSSSFGQFASNAFGAGKDQVINVYNRGKEKALGLYGSFKETFGLHDATTIIREREEQSFRDRLLEKLDNLKATAYAEADGQKSWWDWLKEFLPSLPTLLAAALTASGIGAMLKALLEKDWNAHMNQIFADVLGGIQHLGGRMVRALGRTIGDVFERRVLPIFKVAKGMFSFVGEEIGGGIKRILFGDAGERAGEAAARQEGGLVRRAGAAVKGAVGNVADRLGVTSAIEHAKYGFKVGTGEVEEAAKTFRNAGVGNVNLERAKELGLERDKWYNIEQSALHNAPTPEQITSGAITPQQMANNQAVANYANTRMSGIDREIEELAAKNAESEARTLKATGVVTQFGGERTLEEMEGGKTKGAVEWFSKKLGEFVAFIKNNSVIKGLMGEEGGNKLAQKVGKAISKLTPKVLKKFAGKIAARVASVAAKFAGLGTGVGAVVTAGLSAFDAYRGYRDAAEYFRVDPDKVTGGMKTTLMVYNVIAGWHIGLTLFDLALELVEALGGGATDAKTFLIKTIYLCMPGSMDESQLSALEAESKKEFEAWQHLNGNENKNYHDYIEYKKDQDHPWLDKAREYDIGKWLFGSNDENGKFQKGAFSQASDYLFGGSDSETGEYQKGVFETAYDDLKNFIFGTVEKDKETGAFTYRKGIFERGYESCIKIKDWITEKFEKFEKFAGGFLHWMFQDEDEAQTEKGLALSKFFTDDMWYSTEPIILNGEQFAEMGFFPYVTKSVSEGWEDAKKWVSETWNKAVDGTINWIKEAIGWDEALKKAEELKPVKELAFNELGNMSAEDARNALMMSEEPISLFGFEISSTGLLYPVVQDIKQLGDDVSKVFDRGRRGIKLFFDDLFGFETEKSEKDMDIIQNGVFGPISKTLGNLGTDVSNLFHNKIQPYVYGHIAKAIAWIFGEDATVDESGEIAWSGAAEEPKEDTSVVARIFGLGDKLFEAAKNFIFGGSETVDEEGNVLTPACPGLIKSLGLHMPENLWDLTDMIWGKNLGDFDKSKGGEKYSLLGKLIEYISIHCIGGKSLVTGEEVAFKDSVAGQAIASLSRLSSSVDWGIHNFNKWFRETSKEIRDNIRNRLNQGLEDFGHWWVGDLPEYEGKSAIRRGAELALNTIGDGFKFIAKTADEGIRAAVKGVQDFVKWWQEGPPLIDRISNYMDENFIKPIQEWGEEHRGCLKKAFEDFGNWVSGDLPEYNYQNILTRTVIGAIEGISDAFSRIVPVIGNEIDYLINTGLPNLFKVITWPVRAPGEFIYNLAEILFNNVSRMSNLGDAIGKVWEENYDGPEKDAAVAKLTSYANTATPGGSGGESALLQGGYQFGGSGWIDDVAAKAEEKFNTLVSNLDSTLNSFGLPTIETVKQGVSQAIDLVVTDVIPSAFRDLIVELPQRLFGPIEGFGNIIRDKLLEGIGKVTEILFGTDFNEGQDIPTIIRSKVFEIGDTVFGKVEEVFDRVIDNYVRFWQGVMDGGVSFIIDDIKKDFKMVSDTISANIPESFQNIITAVDSAIVQPVLEFHEFTHELFFDGLHKIATWVFGDKVEKGRLLPDMLIEGVGKFGKEFFENTVNTFKSGLKRIEDWVFGGIKKGTHLIYDTITGMLPPEMKKFVDKVTKSLYDKWKEVTDWIFDKKNLAKETVFKLFSESLKVIATKLGLSGGSGGDTISVFGGSGGTSEFAGDTFGGSGIKQNDPRWADKAIAPGNPKAGTMKDKGCAIAAGKTALDAAGIGVSVDKARSLVNSSNLAKGPEGGITGKYMNDLARGVGAKFNEVDPTNKQSVLKALDSKKNLVTGNKSTPAGHYGNIQGHFKIGGKDFTRYTDPQGGSSIQSVDKVLAYTTAPRSPRVLGFMSKGGSSKFGGSGYRFGGGDASLSSENLAPGAPTTLPFYRAWDERWGDKEYRRLNGSGNNMTQSGCGPTALAMVASWATGTPISPMDVADWTADNGFHGSSGIEWGAFDAYAQTKGFGMKEAASNDEILEALKSGKPVISSQGPGVFTKNGHIITIAGIRPDGSLIVYDPNVKDPDEGYTQAQVFDTQTKAWIPTGNNLGASAGTVAGTAGATTGAATTAGTASAIPAGTSTAGGLFGALKSIGQALTIAIGNVLGTTDGNNTSSGVLDSIASGLGINTSPSTSTTPAPSGDIGPAPGKGEENIPKDADPKYVGHAKVASEVSGLPVDWIWAQWSHETGKFKSDLATECNNYGGLTVPSDMPHTSGMFGVFDNGDDFAKYWGKIILKYNSGYDVRNAKTLDEYIHGIQNQQDHQNYCADPAGTEPYLTYVKNHLGNNGTVLSGGSGGVSKLLYGGSGKMYIEQQGSSDCTAFSANALARAYLDSDPGYTTDTWWSGLQSDLKVQDIGSNDRTEFESMVKKHFDANPEYPIFLYQTNGDGRNGGHPINAGRGDHATVIGRRLANGKYEHYNPAGAKVTEYDLSQIFDPSAKGGTQGTTYGNELYIPTIKPVSAITFEQPAESAAPGQTASANTTPGTTAASTSGAASSGGFDAITKVFAGIFTEGLQMAMGDSPIHEIDWRKYLTAGTAATPASGSAPGGEAPQAKSTGAPNSRPRTDGIVFHHTGHEVDGKPVDVDWSAAEIDRIHRNNGWDGIGYHYVIRKDGTIEPGRDEAKQGAHALHDSGWPSNLDNTNSLGVHLSGTFLDSYMPTAEQIESSKKLVAELSQKYKFPLDASHVIGHKETSNTDCPGNLHGMIPDIIEGAKGYAAGGSGGESDLVMNSDIRDYGSGEDTGSAIAEMKDRILDFFHEHQISAASFDGPNISDIISALRALNVRAELQEMIHYLKQIAFNSANFSSYGSSSNSEGGSGGLSALNDAVIQYPVNTNHATPSVPSLAQQMRNSRKMDPGGEMNLKALQTRTYLIAQGGKYKES